MDSSRNWLAGYWLTPIGLKSWKIDAILNLHCSRTPKALCSFLWAVNLYRDVWPSRAHILNPLTDKAGIKRRDKLNWADKMQTAFVKMKKLMAADTLYIYPNQNLRLDIYNDLSDYHLGAWRPVGYFIKKLSDSQKNCTTMEKELISIVATLQDFCSMLLGAKYIKHKS